MKRQKIKVPNTHKLGTGGKPSRGTLPSLGKCECFLGLEGEDERVMNVFRIIVGGRLLTHQIKNRYKQVNGCNIESGRLKSTLTMLVAENKLKRTENRGHYFYERSN